MALELTGGAGYVDWEISGYANPFNKSYYIDAGITTKNFTSGTTTRPSGIIDSVSAPSSGSRYYSTGSFECEPGTYTFYSFTQTYNGQYWTTGSDTVTVTAAIPSPSAYYSVTATESSITISVKGVASASDYWCYFRCFVYLDGVEVDRSSDSSGGMPYHTSNFTWTASGLKPGTTYTVSVYTANNAWGTDEVESLGSQTVTTKKVAVAVWSWTASNGDATDTQTKNAYAILQGTRPADDFSYLVWNDLVDKIAEVRNARSDISAEWDNAYATKAKTKVAAGNTLSAARFNSICYNINNMKGVSVPYVSTGDVIYGQYITSLVETLNNIIGEL